VGAVGKSGRNRRFQLQDPVLRPVEFFECLRSLCCVVCRLARLWSETGRRICEKEPAKVDHATPVEAAAEDPVEEEMTRCRRGRCG